MNTQKCSQNKQNQKSMNALHSLFSLWSFLSFLSEAPESAAHCWNVAPFNFSSWYYQSYDSWGWHHISAVCVLYLLRHQLTLARAALSISICFFFSALKLSAKSSSHFKHIYLSKNDFLAFSLFFAFYLSSKNWLSECVF